MGRSTGTFPAYVKLDIDPDAWPKSYWDSARKCDTCGEAWPNTHLFKESPCCGAETTEVDSPPDMRWPEAVRELLFYRFGNWYIEYDEGISDEDLLKGDIKPEPVVQNEVSAVAVK